MQQHPNTCTFNASMTQSMDETKRKNGLTNKKSSW